MCPILEYFPWSIYCKSTSKESCMINSSRIEILFSFAKVILENDGPKEQIMWRACGWVWIHPSWRRHLEALEFRCPAKLSLGFVRPKAEAGCGAVLSQPRDVKGLAAALRSEMPCWDAGWAVHVTVLKEHKSDPCFMHLVGRLTTGRGFVVQGQFLFCYF